jgi:hypothetical protein
MTTLFFPIWTKNKEALNDVFRIDVKTQQITNCPFIEKGIHLNSDILFSQKLLNLMQERYNLVKTYKHDVFKLDMGIDKKQLRDELLDFYAQDIYIMRCNLVNLLFSEN